MKEITEIDMNKYLVLKWSDIDTELSSEQRKTLREIINTITKERAEHGKKEHDYLVLNLDDEIDLDYFGDHFFGDDFNENQKIKVKDIAVIIINAILKAK